MESVREKIERIDREIREENEAQEIADAERRKNISKKGNRKIPPPYSTHDSDEIVFPSEEPWEREGFLSEAGRDAFWKAYRNGQIRIFSRSKEGGGR